MLVPLLEAVGVNVTITNITIRNTSCNTFIRVESGSLDIRHLTARRNHITYGVEVVSSTCTVDDAVVQVMEDLYAFFYIKRSQFAIQNSRALDLLSSSGGSFCDLRNSNSTMTNCSVRASQAMLGGVIHQFRGELHIADSTVRTLSLRPRVASS